YIATRRAELMDRVVRLAQGGAQSDVARAIMEALAEVADAESAALYATFEPPAGECLRLAAMGRTDSFPPSIGGEALLGSAKERGATILPLGVADRQLAVAILEKADPSRDRDLDTMASLASTVLAFVDAGETRGSGPLKEGRGRVYTF